MAKTLNLIAHLERLWPQYSAGYVDFCLNLALAFSPNDTLDSGDEKYLKAWLAKWSDLVVVGISGANTPVVVDSAKVKVLQPSGGKLQRDVVIARYEAAFGAASKDSWFVDPSKPRATSTVTDNRLDWLAFQAQQARTAGGIPQSIGFTIHFRINAGDISTYDQICAAPVFSAAGTFGVAVTPLKPTKPVTDAQAELRVAGEGYAWTYKGGPFPVIATVNQCPWNTAPSTGALLDLNSLWAKVSATSQARDWSSEFEIKLADAFDISQRIFELLSLSATAPGTIADLHNAWLGGLYRTVNSGVLTAPDKSTVAGTLLRDSKIGKPEKTLQDYESQLTPAQRNAAIVAATSQAIPPIPNPGGPLDVYLAALSRIYSRSATEDILGRFILDTWKQVFGLTQTELDALGNAIDGVSLRKRLLLGNLGDSWKKLSGDLADLSKLPDTLGKLLVSYSDPLFGGTTPISFSDYLKAFAKTFTAEKLAPTGLDSSNPQTTPEDLVIQIADFQSGSDIQDDAKDPVRSFAGAGLLLKRSGSNTWRCLNLASLLVGKTSSGLDPLPIPIQFHYRNGVRQAFISYSNQPLVALSAAAGLAKNGGFVPVDPGAATPDALWQYANPYGSANGQYQMEGLFYGASYDAAVFLFGASGNLPVQMAKTDEPWAWQMPSADPTYKLTTTFKRRVPVGAVRIGTDSSSSSLAVPRIPEDVRPLARVLAPADSSTPLILLIPQPAPNDVWNRRIGVASFAFTVRPPSVDMAVWYRWVGPAGGGTLAKDDIINIIAAQSRARDVDPSDALVQSRRVASPSIDDPAVQKLVFSLEPVQSTHPAPADLPVDLLPRTGDSLAKVQSGARKVQVQASADIDLTLANGNVQITVPVGDVWRLRIRPLLATTLFADELQGARFGEVTVLLEVASDWPKDNGDKTRAATISRLQGALDAALRVNVTGSTIEANLTFSAAQKTLAQLIMRSETLVQQWRWDGRPPFRFDSSNNIQFGYPLLPAPTTISDPYPQDAVLFASRLSSDHEENPLELDFAQSPDQPHRIYKRDFSSQTAALYFRFGVRVHSRYTGLLADPAPLISIPDDAKKIERWKRALVPCRWSRAVPKPAIKLVLPLTQTWDSSDSGTLSPNRPPVPGFIVQLEEPWYSPSFGLAEYLESSIERVLLPDLSGDTIPQAGPDPLVSMDTSAYGGRTLTMPPLIGAIGSTFDTGTMAPLWVRSSFYQPPPVLETPADDSADSEDPDFAWHFLKLRFRRALDVNAVDKDKHPAALQSDWTDGIWVQILPPSDVLRMADKDGNSFTTNISDLVFDPKTGAITTTGSTSPLRPVTTPVGGGGHARFEWFALVTQEVSDVAGRRDQETGYSDFLRLSKAPAWPVPGNDAAPRLRLRLIEVQYRDSNENDLGNLRAALFSTDANPQDAKARIVRMTRPIANILAV